MEKHNIYQGYYKNHNGENCLILGSVLHPQTKEIMIYFINERGQHCLISPKKFEKDFKIVLQENI